VILGSRKLKDYINTTLGTGGYTMSQYYDKTKSQAYRDGERRGFQLAEIMHAQGRDDDLKRALHDDEYREQLFKEFHIE
jgi:hypothetical protein